MSHLIRLHPTNPKFCNVCGQPAIWYHKTMTGNYYYCADPECKRIDNKNDA